MNKLLLTIGITFLFTSCQKELTSPPQTPVPIPAMEYSDYNDSTVKFGESIQLDIDKDGTIDFYFYTLLVGDAIEQKDKRQYYIGSSLTAYCPVSNKENFPNVAKGENIGSDRYANYTWCDVIGVVLAQKVIAMQLPEYWEGDWKNACHRYMPLFVIKNGAKYFGWLEISFDQQAQGMVIHKAAISKEPNKEVRAGM